MATLEKRGDYWRAKIRRKVTDARNPFLLPIVKITIETAMRQSEIVGLD